MFCLSCFCLQHLVLDLPEVRYGSQNGVGGGPDLSEMFGPVHSYLLCSNLERNLFIDALCSTLCLEVLESCAGSALEPGYNLWSYVEFSDKDHLLKEIATSYKKVRVAAAVG